MENAGIKKEYGAKTLDDLVLYCDLEYHKLIDPDFNLYVGLLYRDHPIIDNRMHFNVILWKDEISNNCILDDFSPSPLTNNSNQWMTEAAQMTVSMASQGKDISDSDDPDDKGFIECYESLKSIGLSDFNIEQIDCMLQTLDEQDE